MMPLRRVAHAVKNSADSDENDAAVSDVALPRVSVVIYAHNAADTLPSLIERLQQQNYPCFELIVVNDGSADMTREVVERLQGEFDNIKYTFVSDTAKNVSRVKVAYTLGVKAAEGDVIVTTAADAYPVSDNWLRMLCAPFAEKYIELSLGYAFIDKSKQQGCGKWMREFDSVIADAQWLGYGLAGHAFRGDQYNMAFRRRTFFEHKGYASSTALKGGHDDLFVSEVASESNTAVVIHPDAHVELDWDASEVKRRYVDDRERRVFMSRFLRTGAFARQGLGSLGRWLMLACVVVASLLSIPNLLASAICAVMLISLWGYEIWLYRRVAHCLHSVRLWWSVPLFMLCRPFVSLSRRQHAFSNSSRHYTWADVVQ